jgi:hypothetical protein
VRVSAADWQTSLQLRRMRALLWGRVLDAKLAALDRAVKAFDPNQPRVPAGNPDGGQWTDGGGGGGDDATSDVRVAQVRRGRRGRGSDAEATQAQLAVRDIREAQAREAIRHVQQFDPEWRPRESADTGSVPGQIRRAEGQIREAEARLRELANQQPTSLIDAFRRQHGLDLLGDPIWSREQNSVSTCQVDGVPHIGVNSQALTYSDRDNATAGQLRDSLIEFHPSRMNTDNIGQFPNNAVFHAEATCLLRAARANGGSLAGKTIEVTVDREMCPSCENILPLIGLELGNPAVTFVDPVGRVRKMHNGKWID